MKLRQIFFILLLPSMISAAELVDDSVYHIESYWLDQNSQRIQINQLQGHIQVVAFIYTYCEHTCPTIISKLKLITQKIPANLQADVKVSLISLDPARDTPEILKTYMIKHALNDQQWTMLHGNADDVLELAALFGVRYKPMGESDIAHSNMITVLDKNGVIRFQMKGLNEDVNSIIKEIKIAVDSAQS